jgi:WD repeat-containing protein 48
VASAGFDRKVSLWDLNESRTTAILTFSTGSQQHGLAAGHVSDSSPKTSIYALATNVHGGIIATGSPEKVRYTRLFLLHTYGHVAYTLIRW